MHVANRWQQLRVVSHGKLVSIITGCILKTSLSITCSKLYGRRKVEIEPVFANLKTHIGLKRFLGRGFIDTSNKVGLALMANNLQKLSKYPNQLHIGEQKNSANRHKTELDTTYYFGF
ncbi:transposase [Lactiplantibacillus plantarum]|uniref:transposase n=1 Tax=Lactiplantibacillus plantarum TaxID=1590 RepID=UPI00387A5874